MMPRPLRWGCTSPQTADPSGRRRTQRGARPDRQRQLRLASRTSAAVPPRRACPDRSAPQSSAPANRPRRRIRRGSRRRRPRRSTAGDRTLAAGSPTPPVPGHPPPCRKPEGRRSLRRSGAHPRTGLHRCRRRTSRGSPRRRRRSPPPRGRKRGGHAALRDPRSRWRRAPAPASAARLQASGPRWAGACGGWQQKVGGASAPGTARCSRGPRSPGSRGVLPPPPAGHPPRCSYVRPGAGGVRAPRQRPWLTCGAARGARGCITQKITT
mmetsp:Transcript_85892/g.256137  ORF Transcript_85892/g.256137 Transcript_85892/m.256137 type:complete len:268 (+) Transcript_85892:627-1430(+)